ncbi:MAG: ATP-binding protein, partial [Bacteroidota bacterium]
IGIDPRDQKMVFDKFFRVTKGDIYFVRGAGLGLSITKSIMDAHLGRIALSSTPGEGSEFRLLFPIVDETTVIVPSVAN